MRHCTRKDFDDHNATKIYDNVYSNNDRVKYLACLDFDADNSDLYHAMATSKKFNQLKIITRNCDQAALNAKGKGQRCKSPT